MLSLSRPARPLSLLCLGAHADDIEIGCCGSVLTLLEQHRDSTVWWVVFSGTPQRCLEARESANRLLTGAAAAQVRVHALPDGFLPDARRELKELFEQLKHELEPGPDLVFTHHRADRHQDHRVVSDLTWETFRHHLILEYEVPKYDGDLGAPNTFIALTDTIRQRKLAHLLDAFPSQQDKRALDRRVFDALLTLRGLESAAASGIAEAFYARKLVLEGSLPGGEGAGGRRTAG
jgi:LmbE family N-acetylglucosaminyl deacetylase